MSESERLEEETIPLVEVVGRESTEESNLLDALAEERQELIENKSVDVPISGYKSVKLFARYRLLEGSEIANIGRKIQHEFKKQYDRALFGSIDVLIAAVQGFFYDAGDGDLKPLTHGGIPIVHYGPELAEALQFSESVDHSQPARSIVLALFKNNEIAISQHNMLLGRWMADTSVDIDEEFWGNV